MHKASILTIFLPREEIFFIEEWLKYHIAIGFTHFYLYNNMGSRWVDCNNNLEVTGKNKRNQSIYQLLAHKTDAEVQQDLDRILEPFIAKGYVTQLMWRPKDENGNITYAPDRAFVDYVRKYARYSDWTSFIDIDEFIVPVSCNNVQDIIEQIEKQQYTYITLPQKCFASRFGENSRPVSNVLGILKCNSWITTEFGKKSLIKNKTLKAPFLNKTLKVPFTSKTLKVPFIKGRYDDIMHQPTTSRSKFFEDKDIIRFNHYKFNEWELNWVRKNLRPDFELDAFDRDITRFYNLMKRRDLTTQLKEIR